MLAQLAPQLSPRATIDAEGTVEGYASLFGVVDSARDMMMPGAFARSLGRRGARRISMLFQHDPAEPIGLWLALEEDARGLRACGRLIPGVQRSREVLALIRAGALDGLSIGFRTVRARVDPVTRIRRILEVDLWEVSIVTFPLLNGARVHALKDRKYSPDQPRVPTGSPDGGQWTSGVGGQSERRVRLAGEWPSNQPPEIPKERPPTAQERNRIVKDVARRLGKGAALAAAVFEATRWLNEYRAEIVANLDPPKSLDALRESVATPKAGYDIHHIVEQTPAAQDGYPRHMIDAPENLVRIPRLKHREINGWYGRKIDEFGEVSPRDYLRGKSWDERQRVGLRALIRHGVLKP
jgi:Escherichia/Staphylococcus phage prohead protease